MIREETYHRLANEFAVGIGIAEWSEPLYGYHSNVAKIPDGLKVVILTQWIINKGIYQQVQKELIRLENKYKNKRIKESTLYEKAIDIIVEKYQIPIE
jgi:hypothetical protein